MQSILCHELFRFFSSLLSPDLISEDGAKHGSERANMNLYAASQYRKDLSRRALVIKYDQMSVELLDDVVNNR